MSTAATGSTTARTTRPARPAARSQAQVIRICPPRFRSRRDYSRFFVPFQPRGVPTTREWVQIDRADPDMCYKFAYYLAERGPEKMDEAIQLALG